MEKLYKHQERVLKENKDKCLISFDTGLGKTRTAIELVKQKNATGLLVICPKGIKEKWKQDLAYWGCNIPYEVLSLHEVKKRASTGILSLPEVIISDEHHNTLGTKSQIGKLMRSIIKSEKYKYFYALTATPFRSSPWDIFVLCYHFKVFLNMKKFESDFFTKIKIGHRMIPMPKRNWRELGEIKKEIDKFSYFAKMEECFDVPEQIDDIVYFDFDYERSEDVPIVAFSKDHQEEAMCSVKIDYLKEIVENNDKVVIVCKYLEQIEKYSKIFDNVLIVSGETVDREEVIKRANEMEKCVLLVSSGCSEGWEIPTFGIMVFASLSFSYVQYIQMKGRIHRANHLKKNIYIHLLVRGRDTEVYECLKNKRDVSDYLT